MITSFYSDHSGLIAFTAMPSLHAKIITACYRHMASIIIIHLFDLNPKHKSFTDVTCNITLFILVCIIHKRNISSFP